MQAAVEVQAAWRGLTARVRYGESRWAAQEVRRVHRGRGLTPDRCKHILSLRRV